MGYKGSTLFMDHLKGLTSSAIPDEWVMQHKWFSMTVKVVDMANIPHIWELSEQHIRGKQNTK